MKRSMVSALPRAWESIRYSYWLIPSIMAVLALGFALTLVRVDQVLEDSLVDQLGWFYAGGSDGAREVLSAIAGSMITVAGVVFSITMVALTLASSQFGPRVLRNFMQDRGSQIVLGMFIGTFVYSLAVLRTIQGGEAQFVPQLSVTTGVMLAMASLGFLIYFIHHVALSIQGSYIVARIGRELFASIDRYFPEKGTEEEAGSSAALPEGFEEEAVMIPARTMGYLQDVDYDALVEMARKADVVLRLESQPGDFISPYRPLLFCWPAFRCEEGLHDDLVEAFTVGRERSHAQDVLFPVDQLVEIAVRSLSPGINDPFTAVRCLDWLGAALSHCLSRRPSREHHRDEDGNLRLAITPVTFARMADSAFEQIQEYGRRSAAITIHLLDILADLGRNVGKEDDRTVLLKHARRVLEGSYGGAIQEYDQERVQQRYRELLSRI